MTLVSIAVHICRPSRPVCHIARLTVCFTRPRSNYAMSSLSHDRVAASAAEKAALRRALAEAGWRFTRQREAVYFFLRSAADHPTAEQVYQAVRRQIANVSLATVYKALEALVDAHLAAKLPDASGPARFDCRSDWHYHLRDVESGQVRDLLTPYDPALLDKLDPNLMETLRRQGFRVLGHHLELLGHFQD
jgi:Fe2+ or Zn2+ uptake regulation protein